MRCANAVMRDLMIPVAAMTGGTGVILIAEGAMKTIVMDMAHVTLAETANLVDEAALKTPTWIGIGSGEAAVTAAVFRSRSDPQPR